MSTAERKEREKERRRNEIVDAAEKLFFSRGYESVTMDDIAKETELARGTLYLYFKNKDNIYIAIAIRGVKILNRMCRESYHKGEPGIGMIRSMLFAVYEFYKKYPGYYTTNMSLVSRGLNKKDFPEMEEMESTHLDSFGIVLEALKAGIKDGTVRGDVDPAKSTFILSAFMQGLLNTSPDDVLVEYGVDMMLRSIESIG